MQVTLPQINMNGDTIESLLAEAENAYRKVRDASAAVAKITVHGRNFQTTPSPTLAYTKAVSEKTELMAKLADVESYLINLYNGIADQGR